MKECEARCPYFPYTAGEVPWVYDKNYPYIKRRRDPFVFKCGYDNHVITSWAENICPLFQKDRETLLGEK